MYNIFATLLILQSLLNITQSANQCLFLSETQTANNSKGRSINSNNSGEDEDLMCNRGPSSCVKSRYRSIDGSCNNLLHPGWGMPQRPYARLLPYNYGDGISSFPKSVTGKNLRNARELRLSVFPDKVIVDTEHSLITMQWGQIVVHDMSLTSGVPQTNKQPLTCCNPNGTFAADAETNPLCAPIHISRGDPIYGSQGKICMDFVRTRSTKNNNCTAPDIPAEPLSSVTSYMDLSLVYGHNKSQADAVRAGCGGRLLTLMRNGQEWPPQDPEPELACDMLMYPNSPCYLAGDIRVNQNPQLALLQVILLREHNRIADRLHILNPHWDDEKLFQEARRILIAVFQQINYYEYLPTIIGLKNMINNKLIYLGVDGYINDYNQSVDPSVYAEHATVAFRIFHSSIRGYLQKYTESRNLVGEARLSNFFNNPSILEENNNFDDLARGFSVQSQSYSDKYFDEENVRKLEANYESIEDVELAVAGALEYQVPNTQVGPTFKCIITRQFHKTRVGDRFFFENGADPETAFKLNQLQSIRRGALISRLLCDNVVSIKSMQLRVFEKLSIKNKIVSCDELPYVDLTLWKEETP